MKEREKEKLKDKFPSHTDFNTFLKSDDNKCRLQTLIKNELIRLRRSFTMEMMYSCAKAVYDISKNRETTEFICDQFEADTIMFSIYHKIRTYDDDTLVVIDAADTDCYAQSAAISKLISGPLAIKRKEQLIKCDELCSSNIADIIIQFYTMTGCDSNNGFYGHGKNSIFEKLTKVARFRDMIKDVGKVLPLPDATRKLMKSFVIEVIYGDSKSVTSAEARAAKWKTLKKKSTLRLCPDDDTLNHYCDRANYLSYIQLHPELYMHPPPIGHGWWLADGHCRPIRNTLPTLPSDLMIHSLDNSIDNVSSSSDGGESDEEESSGDDMDALE